MEERISKLENRVMELIQSYQPKEKRMKNGKDSLRDLRDNIKQTLLHHRGLRRKERESLFEEIMTGNLPNRERKQTS